MRLFSNKKTQKVDEIDTVIGLGTKFEGNIEATGIVRIDGSYIGNIATKGDLIIGEDGKVDGEVKARNIIVAGTSQAKLNCEGKLEIRETGKVMGDVEVGSIIIEDKAVFAGNCIMRYDDKLKQKESENA